MIGKPLLLLCCISAFVLQAPDCSAQAPVTTDATSVQELDVLRSGYQRNLAAIHASAESRLQPVRAAYLANLERMEKDPANSSNTLLLRAIAEERERTSSKQDTSPAQKGLLPPALSTLRTRFDADKDRTLAQFTPLEQQQTRQYLSSLETLQRKLLAQNQVQKAAVVGAERTSIAGNSGPKLSERDEKPIAESTVSRAGQLDATLGDKIQAAIKAKQTVKTETSTGEPQGWSDLPDDGALLVGFEFMEVKSPKGAWIRSLRPYFMNRNAIVPGQDRGKMLNITDKVLARPGYAVSGLLTSDAKTGMQVIFSKIDPATGKFDPNPSNTYKSKWYGTKTREKPVQIGGDGRLVIGIFGKTGADCDTVGLITLP